MTATTIEIAPDKWPDFWRRVANLHAGETVSLETVESDGRKQLVADQVTLQQATLDGSGPCSDRLTIEYGKNESRNAHIITEPISIRLREGGSGRYKAVEIHAEAGSSILTLQPGLNPAAFQGVF